MRPVHLGYNLEIDNVDIRFALSASLNGNQASAVQLRNKFRHPRPAHAYVSGQARVFNTRCWKAQDMCRSVARELLQVGASQVACHFPE